MQEKIRELNYDYDAQAKNQVNICNLCDTAAVTIISKVDRYGYKANAVSCNRCGLIYLNPRMTKSGYLEFYKNIYRPLLSAFYGRLYDEFTIQEMQAAYARDRINFLYTFLKTLNGKKMLDVGGSTGVIAKIFKQEFGLIPTIIDPAPLETSRARLLGLETVTGFVEDFEMAKNLYDFIALFQTVDHLMDIARVLEKIHSILDKNGLFFVDIVDFTAAVKRNKSITKSIKIDHPYYLTDNTMRRYLSKFGFEVIQREYASDGLHIGYVCKKHVKL